MGYQWTFIVKEVINFSETTFTVYGDTIDEALEKIEFLRIAEFMEIDNLKDKLKLMDVLEMEDELDLEIEDDPENISANKE
jgi:hypothetical protein